MSNTRSFSALPVDIVFHPSWWHQTAGLVFDEDFFFHPKKRVEVEQIMEKVLYERFGQFGLGKYHDIERPVIGAVHLAAGFFLSEIMGCKVEYYENSSPLVLPLNCPLEAIELDRVLKHKRLKSLESLIEQLRLDYSYVCGDINWSGVLNLALDLRGNELFYDFIDEPEQTDCFLQSIFNVIDHFISWIGSETQTTSISVNRTILHTDEKTLLHSECSHTMISEADYRKYFMKYDQIWSQRRGPFGIHYCGNDPHRFAATYSELAKLDFFDVGWGGDVKHIRANLPNTFLNLRLSPVEIKTWDEAQMREIIFSLIDASGNPNLTGICCINMDEEVTDKTITTLFNVVQEAREHFC